MMTPEQKNRFDELMRDICERDDDLESERIVIVDYDWLYQRLKDAMGAA